MATGIEVLLATICYNVTFCEYVVGKSVTRRGTMDEPILVLRIIMEKYRENDMPLHLLFLDLHKVFDCGEHPKDIDLEGTAVEDSTKNLRDMYSDDLNKAKAEVKALRKELNGKHLVIGTYDNYPLSWTEVDENGTIRGRGISFEIVEILRNEFNFTFDVVVPKKNFEFGGENPDDSLIGLVNNSLVDFGAAFLPMLHDFQQYVMFSSGLDEGTWTMMLKRPKESAAGSGLLAPFEFRVWFLILAAVLSYGPFITFLTRMRVNLVRDGERHITLSPSFWFVYGAFIKQGTTLSPDANTTRVLFATWWIFIILLSAFYTANLTAFLTLSKFTLDIENPQDLYKKNYRWMAPQGSSVQLAVEDPNDDLYYLATMITKGRAEFRPFSNATEFLPLVYGGAVLVKEQIAIDYLMYDDYVVKASQGVEEADRCTYVVAPNAFMKRIRAFAYPKTTKLNKLFDPVITHIVQGGIIQHLSERDLPSTKICPLDLQSKDRRLQNRDLLMTYLIMVTGLSAATAAFIVELLLKRRNLRSKIRDGTQKQSRKKKKIHFKPGDLEEQDSVPPPTYDSLFGGNSMYRRSAEKEVKVINGREYWIVRTVSGDQRLIPIRTPSAFLWNR